MRMRILFFQLWQVWENTNLPQSPYVKTVYAKELQEEFWRINTVFTAIKYVVDFVLIKEENRVIASLICWG